ncbi:hypothetical protein [Raoultella ornithinolytica]|uniref:hypothetical protein n=1 Tax=Raoultella ornithinolytica TaxID=54291 RepID=UPI003D6F71AD
MTDITEDGKWEGSIPFITRSDRVEGGRAGLINVQAGRLANRTAYLKAQLDAYNGLLKSGELPFTSETEARDAISAGKIPEGAIFSVRSTNPYFWVDEYQNIAGEPVATGRHLPGNLLTAPMMGVTASDPDGTLAGLSVTQEGQYFLVIDGTSLTYYVNKNAVARVVLRIPGDGNGESALLTSLEMLSLEVATTSTEAITAGQASVENRDATAGLITALESLALLFAQTSGDMSEIQTIARENGDAVARVLTAYELLTSRVANAPEELARIQLNFGFSLDIVLDALFKLSQYDFDDFITTGDIPATIKPMGQLTYIPELSDINAFISYGQSLSNGGGAGNSAISTTQPYSNLTYSSGPVGTTFTATKPLVESGPETICSGMSNYASLTALRDDGVKPEDHVIFSGAPGRGSTSIAALSKGGAAWTKFENFVKNIPVVNPGKTCALHVVPYLQGENDQDPDRTPYATYLAALLQLQADITELAQTELGQKTPVYMLTYQHNTHTTINNAATQRAFVQAQRQSDYFTLVTPTYPFPHNSDTIHLTSIAYKWLGAYFGRAYKQLVIERRRPDNVFPMGATWSGNEVRVKFRVPVAPLTFNTTRVPLTTNYGFKVQTAAGVAIGISSVAIEGDDTVLITLSSTPAAAPLVRYALDYLAPGLIIVNGASGNLCDSTNEKCTFGGTDYSMEYYSPAFELQSYTISI